MELIPIIYTTLIIFAIVTIVTIISSYVSYKVKRKVNNEDEKDKEKFTKLHEPIVSVKKPLKKRISSKPKNIPEKNYQKEKTEVRHEKRSGGHDRKQHKKPELPERTKRLNVLNLPDLPKPKVEKKEEAPKSKKINYNSLGDDILDKYADNNDDNFHSLNATKDED